MDSRLVRTVELSLSPLERVKAMWRNMADDSAWTVSDTPIINTLYRRDLLHLPVLPESI